MVKVERVELTNGKSSEAELNNSATLWAPDCRRGSFNSSYLPFLLRGKMLLLINCKKLFCPPAKTKQDIAVTSCSEPSDARLLF